MNYFGARSKKSNSRKRRFGKTKPNFNKMINHEVNSFLSENKDYLLANKPEIYYSMKGRKLPKKYKNQQYFINPLKTNSNQSDLNFRKNEKKVKNVCKIIKRKPDNRNSYIMRKNYIYWCDPFEPINKDKLGSTQEWKKEKKYEYY